MRLFIIRHAQCLSNLRFGGGEPDSFDDPLTDIGVRQAQALAQHFARYQAQSRSKVAQVYSSPLRRALQTASPIAAAIGVPLEIWTDLYEYKEPHIKREGMTWQAIRREFPKSILPDHMTDAGWWQLADDTSPAECYRRGQKVAQALQERAANLLHQGKRDAIILVTHLMFADALVRGIANLPSDGVVYPFFYHQNAAMTEFVYLDDQQRSYVNAPTAMLGLNQVSHLPPELLTPEPGMEHI